MATYSGRVVEIIPEKQSYTQGEKVRAKVRFQVERTDGIAWYAWHARVKVYSGGVLKDEDETTFTMSTITQAYDRREHTTRFLNLGSMPASSMACTAEIWAGG